tara:strand:+ start:153 stop:467 length:315 start_codon:yes stop_codon:yes gene_type:complete
MVFEINEMWITGFMAMVGACIGCWIAVTYMNIRNMRRWERHRIEQQAQQQQQQNQGQPDAPKKDDCGCNKKRKQQESGVQPHQVPEVEISSEQLPQRPRKIANA